MTPASPPRWILRATGWGVAVIVVTSYMGWRAQQQPEPKVTKFQGGIAEPERYTSPAPDATAAAPKGSPQAPVAGASTGTMIVAVQDQNGRGVEGLPVEVTGMLFRRATTDGKGQVKIVGPPGRYAFNVAGGCTDSMEIANGGSGNGEIVAGTSITGTIRVTWRHRYRPFPPSFASESPVWKIGRVIDVGYFVVDRCANLARSPNVAFPTWTFRTSPNLEIVENPLLRSDDNAHGHLRLRCISPGPVELIPIDTKNASDDRVDLLREMISTDGTLECAH